MTLNEHGTPAPFHGAGDEPVLGELAHLLPTVLAQYLSFAGEVPPVEAKAFTAHQTACRAALAHLNLLARSVDALAAKKTAEGSAGTAEAILVKARAALSESDDDGID